MGGPRKRTSEGIDRLSASTNRYPAYFRLLRGDCSQMPGKKSQELKHFLQVLVLEGSAKFRVPSFESGRTLTVANRRLGK